MSNFKSNIKENPTKGHRRRLAKLAEVLDELNRTYGVVPTPAGADADKGRRE